MKTSRQKEIIVIGAGFSGLSAASFLAKAGHKVTVLEKHSTPGGRARQLKEAGFTFDMGPSWYWMPDVFERYFSCFGKETTEYYHLKRLDPSYTVYWPEGSDEIPADRQKLDELFESWEPGAAKKLAHFLKEAEYKYMVGMQKLVYKPGLSLMEFADASVIGGMFRLDVFSSMKKHVGNHFQDERARQLMEFPVLFLGALPEDTPALYSLMNYADIEGGTWYPDGGMYSVVDAMYKLALELGVNFRFDEAVTGFGFNGSAISEVITGKGRHTCDGVIGSADYQFIEQSLLPEPFRMYSPAYWNSRELSPSCLLYYVGISKKLEKVRHHSLFFDAPFDTHGREIYRTKEWPNEPLFYVSVSSVTDQTVAPEGCENLFFLIPVAAGLTGDTTELREDYFDRILARFEKRTGESVKPYIIYKKTFAYSDFVSEYNSFKGNAYGLANTLSQTAILKPKCRSKKVKNLFYTGQLTVPGPGVPPSLISGEVVAGVANAYLNHRS